MHRLCCAADGAESGSQPIWLFPRAAERQPLAVLGATCSVVFLVVFIVVYAGHLGLTEETRWASMAFATSFESSDDQRFVVRIFSRGTHCA